MNRFRNAGWSIALAGLAVLAACGPKITRAKTAADPAPMSPPAQGSTMKPEAMPKDTMPQDTMKPQPMPKDQTQGAMASASPLSALATLQAGPEVAGFSGTITFTSTVGGVRMVADVKGVPPGKHGLHLHANGQCNHDDPSGKHYNSAGGHFNPANAPHACPPTDPRHAGDFGNIEIAADGTGHLDLTSSQISLSGTNGLAGKAVILHAGADDCTTQPTGNSGDRLACGVIEMQGMSH